MGTQGEPNELPTAPLLVRKSTGIKKIYTEIEEKGCEGASSPPPQVMLWDKADKVCQDPHSEEATHGG